MKQSLLISAGEASGELHAANLWKELSALLPEGRAFGMGGERMREAGVELSVDSRALQIMGFAEVLPKLLGVRRAMRRLTDLAASRDPVCAVLVDFAGFNMRLARRLRERGVRIVYYISPKVWAWRRGRVKTLARLVDLMLVIMPFEEAIYEEAGCRVKFVGNPLLDAVRPAEADELRARLAPGAATLVSLLPGSRIEVVRRHAPVFARAAALMGERRPGLAFAASESDSLPKGFCSRLFPGMTVVRGRSHELLAASSLAVCASGTTALECAILGVPAVVCYRASRITYAVARALVRIKHVSLVNILAEREVVPELIQSRMTPRRIADEALRLLSADERKKVLRGYEEAVGKLGGPGASRRAAEEIVRLVREGR